MGMNVLVNPNRRYGLRKLINVDLVRFHILHVGLFVGLTEQGEIIG